VLLNNGATLTLRGLSRDFAELQAGTEDADENAEPPAGRAEWAHAEVEIEVYAHDLFDVRLVVEAGEMSMAAAVRTSQEAQPPASSAALAAAPPPQGAPQKRASYNKTASIRAQVEFYFSEKNLLRDAFMREQIAASADGCVALPTIRGFARVARMGLDDAELAEALRESTVLELSADRSTVRLRQS